MRTRVNPLPATTQAAIYGAKNCARGTDGPQCPKCGNGGSGIGQFGYGPMSRKRDAAGAPVWRCQWQACRHEIAREDS